MSRDRHSRRNFNRRENYRHDSYEKENLRESYADFSYQGSFENQTRRENSFAKKGHSFDSRRDFKKDGRREKFGGNFYDEKKSPKTEFHTSAGLVTAKQLAEENKAIEDFKHSKKVLCSKCGIEINDMSSAIEGRNGEGPMHFDCALEEISKTEKLGLGDKITYIGQGRFGIVNHQNPHDMKHFTIKKIIEWESKDSKPEWRNEMAELYSRVR